MLSPKVTATLVAGGAVLGSLSGIAIAIRPHGIPMDVVPMALLEGLYGAIGGLVLALIIGWAMKATPRHVQYQHLPPPPDPEWWDPSLEDDPDSRERTERS